MDRDPDSLCMERLRDGDDQALNELMQRWKEPLAAFCLRYTGNAADAGEIAQETFVKVYGARGRYRRRAAFSTWLFAIAANLCRMRHRWRRRHPELLDADRGREAAAAELNADPAGADPAAETDRRALARDLDEAVRRLPHSQRTAFILHELHGRSCREIAGIQNSTEKAVERRLARARLKLRSQLEKKWS